MALERGLDVLAWIAEKPEGLSFSEVWDRLACAKPAASRLLKALKARELIVKDPVTRRFHRGPGLVRLAQGMEWAPTSRKALAHAADPELDRLRQECQHSLLAAHWGGRALECVTTALAVDGLAVWSIGDRRDNFEHGPLGWCILKERGEALPAGAEDADACLREYRWCAQQRPASWRLAAPVRCRGDRLVGVLGCFANPLTCSDDDVFTLGQHLREAADAVARQLGWTPPAPEPAPAADPDPVVQTTEESAV
jgi:DNA-binding IclR family transcriptional regulator